jgi:hypothetical protein
MRSTFHDVAFDLYCSGFNASSPSETEISVKTGAGTHVIVNIQV